MEASNAPVKKVPRALFSGRRRHLSENALWVNAQKLRKIDHLGANHPVDNLRF